MQNKTVLEGRKTLLVLKVKLELFVNNVISTVSIGVKYMQTPVLIHALSVQKPPPTTALS